MLKLGRKPAVYDGRALHLAAYTDAAELPPTPPAYDWSKYVTVEWGMDGNDTVGDCTVAALAHIIMATSASAGSIVIPTLAQCMGMYEDIGHYVPGDPSTDNGATEVAALNYMRQYGLQGQKVDAYADINIANTAQLKTAIAVFGPAYIGVWLSQTDMDDFQAGKGWADLSDTDSIGGHALPVVGYDDFGVEVVTWARKQPASWAWLAQHMDEAHIPLFFDVIGKNGRTVRGFHLSTLQHDLALVTA